jgi:hypothetical protein
MLFDIHNVKSNSKLHPVFSRNAAAAFHYQIFVSNSAKNASHGKVRKLKKSFD